MLASLALYEGFDGITWLVPEEPNVRQIGWLVSAVGCVLVLQVKASKTLQHLLTRRPLVFLGRISYSVYLLQFIVIMFLLPRMVDWIYYFTGTRVIPAVLLALIVFISVCVTICLATVAHRLVEVPAIDLGHRLSALIPQRTLRSEAAGRPVAE